MNMDDFIKQDTARGRTPTSPPVETKTPSPSAPTYTPPTGGLFSQLGKMSGAALKAGASSLLGPGGIYLADDKFRGFVNDLAIGTVRSAVKPLVQLPRAFAAGVAGTVGATDIEASLSKPVDVPVIGKVKGLSAVPSDSMNYGTQTPWEDVAQAADMWLTAGAPGAGKAFGLMKKVLPGLKMSKVAEVASSIPARQFEKAAEPEMAQAIKNVRETGMGETPQDLALKGEEAYNAAKKLMDETKTAYGETRASLIKANEGKLIQRSKDFSTEVNGKLSKEGIDLSSGKPEFIGSTFEGDDVAQATLSKAHELMTRPAVQRKGFTVAEDLINRRQAISALKNKVPLEEGNLRRVLGEMKDAFDDVLDRTLGPEAANMRSAYKKAKEITAPITDTMTVVQNGQKVFSMDKAYGFIKQAMSDLKFDKNALLQKLDSEIGTTFARDVQAMGLDKAISRLTPPTASRLADVAKSYIALNPVTKYLVPIFSPKFWGDQAVRQGLKTATKGVAEANKLNKALIINLLAAPVREQGYKQSQSQGEYYP